MKRTISFLLFVLVLASAFLCSCEGEHSGTPASTSDDVTPAVTEETDEISAGTSEQVETTAEPEENEDPLIGTWVHVGEDNVKALVLYTLNKDGSCIRGYITTEYFIKYNDNRLADEYSVDGNYLDIYHNFYYEGKLKEHRSYASGEYVINDNTLTFTDSSGTVTCTMKRFSGFDQKPTVELTKDYVRDVMRYKIVQAQFFDRERERNYLDKVDSYDIDIKTDFFKTVSAGKSYGAMVSVPALHWDEDSIETMYFIWVPSFECWALASTELQE